MSTARIGSPRHGLAAAVSAFASDKLGSVPEIDRAVSVAVPACGCQGLSISIKGEAADDAFVGDDRLMEARLW